MSSDIATIVDVTAAMAARVQGVKLPNGSVVGVRSTFGAGQGVIADPLVPGGFIRPCPERPEEPLMHLSKVPDAPDIVRLTQDGYHHVIWTLPMTLYVQRADASTAVQVAMPFYDAYLSVFAPDPTLGGLCNVSRMKVMKPDSDDAWYWLDMELEVEEIVKW